MAVNRPHNILRDTVATTADLTRLETIGTVRSKWSARKSALQTARIERLERQVESLAETLDAVIERLVAGGHVTKAGLEKARASRSSAKSH